MRLLLVEDDELLVQALSNRLAAQRYAVDVAVTGEDGWSFAQATTYDLIVLDVNLPKLSGLDLCHRLRQVSYRQPILLLTAKSDRDDKVAGLDAGADDYVVKPCDIEELCARIRALLRRQQESATPQLAWGDLRLDPSCCEVTYQTKLVSLSSKEYSLLELFLRYPQRFFSSGSVLEHLWRFEDAPGEETVRTLVKRLRHKLKLAGADDVIETFYGQGYRLKPLPDRSVPTNSCPREAAFAAWEQFKEPMLKQLAVIDDVVTRFPTGSISQAERDQAKQAAHKLAGSLGMFGFPHGSQLGRELEHWLEMGNAASDPAQLMSLVAQLRQELQTEPQALSALAPPDSASRLAKTNKGELALLLISEDTNFIHSLQLEGKNCGIQIDPATSMHQARSQWMQQSPLAVLLDLGSLHSSQEGLEVLEELAVQWPHLPVLVFVSKDELSDRLEIAHRHRCQLISKALSTRDLLATVQATLASSRLAETKILAVDDDPLTLQALQQSLSGWGVHLFTLTNPAQFWQTLTTIKPDLLILDVEMPQVNGIELCQVVRSDRAWHHLPILFLTVHQDVTIIQQVFRAGADDYLTKPFAEPDLISRLCSRLSRSRCSRSG